MTSRHASPNFSARAFSNRVHRTARRARCVSDTTLPTRSLDLEHFLSQIRYASAVFSPNKNLIHFSPRFVMLFDLPSENAPYADVFGSDSFLSDKIAQVFAQKTPFYLYEAPVSTQHQDELFNIEIFPLV